MDYSVLSPTAGARRRRLSCVLLPVFLGLIVSFGGCADRTIEVSVQQPIAFAHKTHLDYFASGRHPEEGIKMHVELLNIKKPEDIPPSLPGGDCLECHKENLTEKTACVGCHLAASQDVTLRGRKDVRRCVVCHRGTWVGTRARIPSVATCVSCHRPNPSMTITNAAVEKQTQTDLARAEDVPWVQINTVAPDVYFSHPAHVRYRSLACTTCHDDVTSLTAPPTAARVYTMTNCLKCHVTNGASVTCLICHK